MTTITKAFNGKPSIIDGRQITFLDQRFYYVNGQFLPSVTTILDAYPKEPSYYAWLKKVGEEADEIRNAAGDRGSTVHQMTEDLDAGIELSLLDSETGFQQYSVQEWAMAGRYVEFITRFAPEILASELTLYSLRYKMAGTLDRLIELNGKRYILDIKTSNAIYDTYWLQVAAYSIMLDQEVDGVAILWLNAKTRTEGKGKQVQGVGWQLLIEDDQSKINDYISTLMAVRQLWDAQNKDLQPKNISYSLTIKI